MPLSYMLVPGESAAIVWEGVDRFPGGTTAETAAAPDWLVTLEKALGGVDPGQHLVLEVSVDPPRVLPVHGNPRLQLELVLESCPDPRLRELVARVDPASQRIVGFGTRKEMLDCLGDLLTEGRMFLVLLRAINFAARMEARQQEQGAEDDAAEEAAKELTDPRWEHTNEAYQGDRRTYVVPRDVVNLTASASGFAAGTVVTFEIVRVLRGAEEPVDRVDGQVGDMGRVTAQWTVPSSPARYTATNDVYYRFHASAEDGEYRTEQVSIDGRAGVEVWLEIDPLAPRPADDVLELVDVDEQQPVQRIEVVNAPDVAPGYKSLFLSMSQGRRYDLMRWYDEAHEAFDLLFTGLDIDGLLRFDFDPPRIENIFLLSGLVAPANVFAAMAAARGRGEVRFGPDAVLSSRTILGREALTVEANRFFFMLPGKEGVAGSPAGVDRDGPTLVATDQHGRLCHVDAWFHARPFGIQRLVGFPALALLPVASGVARYAYVWHGKNWQNTLLEFAGDFQPGGSQAGKGDHLGNFVALPVTVEEASVRRGDGDRRLFRDTCRRRNVRAGNRSEPGGPVPPIVRYVFPKIQIVFLLIPEHAIDPDLDVRDIPPARIWHRDADPSEAVQVGGAWQSLTWSSHLGQEEVSRGFLVYSAMNGVEAFENQALYRVAVPGEVFHPRIRAWLSARGEDDFLVSVRVSFEARTLMSEVAFHVIEPISIERSLIIAFPGQFLDVACHLVVNSGGESAPKAAKGAFRTWFDRLSLYRSRQKTALDLVSSFSELATAAGTLGEAGKKLWTGAGGEGPTFGAAAKNAGSAARKTATKTLSVLPDMVEDPELKQIFTDFSAILAGTKTLLDMDGKWRSMVQRVRNLSEEGENLRKNIETIYRMSDGSLPKKIWDAHSWNQWAAKELGSGRPSDLALEFARLKDEERLGEFIADGLPSALGKLEIEEANGIKTVIRLPNTGAQRLMSVAGVGLNAVDLALDFYKAWGAADALIEAYRKLRLENDRLRERIAHWTSKWRLAGSDQVAPELTQVEYLLSAFRLVENLRLDIRRKAWELFKAWASLALDLIAFIPGLNVLGALVIVAKDTLSAGYDVFQGGLRLLDRAVLEGQLAQWKSDWTYARLLRERWSAVCAGLAERARETPADELSRDPMFQGYVREAILIGLLQLLRRCGSRWDDPQAFEAKVAQYRVREYIQRWLSGKPTVPFIIWEAEYAGQPLPHCWPLEQLWLDAVGNKNQAWNEDLWAQARLQADQKVRVEWMTVGYMYGVAWKVGRILVHTTFQDWFPLHYFESDDILDLAEQFSHESVTVSKEDFACSKVYLWKDGEWRPTSSTFESSGQQGASPWPQPNTPVRIVVVFKKRFHIPPTPASIQLIRTDTLPDTFGPVYKVFIDALHKATEPRVEQADGAGGDKAAHKFQPLEGLLPIDIEALRRGGEEILSDDDLDGYSGLVFYPFFSWNGQVYHGTKPTGHLALAPNQSMDVKFRLKIGERRFDIGDTENGRDLVCDDVGAGDLYRVRVTGADSALSPFILDRAFLMRKTSKEGGQPVFLGETVSAGVCLRQPGQRKWTVYTADADVGDQVVNYRRFDFDWTKPFDAIFLVWTMSFVNDWVQRSDLTFPAAVGVKQVIGYREPTGPKYPGLGAAVMSIDPRDERFFSADVPASERSRRLTWAGDQGRVPEDLTRCLMVSGVLDAGDQITAYRHLTAKGFTPRDRFSPPWSSAHLAAIRASFAYSIETDEAYRTYEAFKPFGRFPTGLFDSPKRGPDADPFIYRFRLSLPGYSTGLLTLSEGDLEVDTGVNIELPPLPIAEGKGDGTWDHLAEDQFVEKQILWKELKLQEWDYKPDSNA